MRSALRRGVAPATRRCYRCAGRIWCSRSTPTSVVAQRKRRPGTSGSWCAHGVGIVILLRVLSPPNFEGATALLLRYL